MCVVVLLRCVFATLRMVNLLLDESVLVEDPLHEHLKGLRIQLTVLVQSLHLLYSLILMVSLLKDVHVQLNSGNVKCTV